jgi:AraC-like DNA-binding protein/quercetin dioxygenase-like cupin family protein
MVQLKKKEGFDGQKAVIIPRSILANQCEKSNIIHNLFVTDIGYYPKAVYHHRERPQGAAQHILVYCDRGAGDLTLGTATFQILSGDFFIIPRNTPHVYSADLQNPWTIYWVHFKGSSADAVVDQLMKNINGFKGSIRFMEKSIDLFNEIYRQLERGYSNDNLIYANMCLSHFLTTFIYNHKFEPVEEGQVKDNIDLVIDYMQNNMNKPLRLEQIANFVNLSSSHFSFLFKKKTGYAPMEYFNQLKIQKACQYLLFTNLQIKEIAFKLGVEDPYYFSRLFTNVMGVSPNNYREKRSQ